MKKIFLLSIFIFSFTSVYAQEESSSETSQATTKAVTYGVKFNDETNKNEIYRINDDGTETLLVDFEFPSGGWQSSNSYVNTKNGKLYLYDAGGGPGGGVTEEERGFVVYDPATNTITKGVKDGYVTGFQATFNGVYALDDLISEDTDGEIHIGENSLVTIEQDGKQQLYATDANGDQIDINIKKGSDLLVDGKSVSQAITDVATNKTNIATNTTNIAPNTQAISSLGTRVDGLTNLVNTFDQRITDLQTLTGTMMSEYRSGIASSVALSQIRYASKGFSIGVGQGEFKDKDEMAVGIGYGGEFNDRVGYQFQFGSSGDTSGFGFTITF